MEQRVLRIIDFDLYEFYSVWFIYIELSDICTVLGLKLESCLGLSLRLGLLGLKTLFRIVYVDDFIR